MVGKPAGKIFFLFFDSTPFSFIRKRKKKIFYRWKKQEIYMVEFDYMAYDVFCSNVG